MPASAHFCVSDCVCCCMPVTNVLAIVCGICIQRDKLREAEMKKKDKEREKVGISASVGALLCL